MSLMLSDHFSPSRSAMSLSEYAVIFSIHCKFHKDRHVLPVDYKACRVKVLAAILSNCMSITCWYHITLWVLVVTKAISVTAGGRGNVTFPDNVLCQHDTMWPAGWCTCFMGRRITGWSPRSDLPSMISSLARTVPRASHQLTGTSAW